MFERWRAGASTRLLIGAPVRPMPSSIQENLRTVLRGCQECLFAYTPLVYIAGRVDPPAQVLYVVFRDDARVRRDDLMRSLADQVHRIMPKGEFIDVLPAFADDRLLRAVILSGCVLVVNDELAHQKCIDAARRENRGGSEKIGGAGDY